MSGVSRNYPEGTGKLLRFEYNETDEMVVTQRTPQNAYLLVDSIDRYTLTREGLYDDENETNPNDIYISHQKLNGFGEIKRVFVSDVYFPWRTPNINIRNQVFELRINGVDYYLTVPEDFYKPSELASTMQTIANSATGFRTTASQGTTPVYFTGATWVITSDAIGRFTVTATGATFTTETVLDVKGYENNLNGLMNFFSSNPPVASAKGGIASMTYTKYIDFVSTNLTKHQRLKDCLTQFNYTNIIYRLYLNNENQLPLTDDTYFSARPSDIYRQITNPKTIMWNKNEMISAIDIKLYDDGGELLYIPADEWDTNYLMTIQLSES
jgi:hypothetical protein